MNLDQKTIDAITAKAAASDLARVNWRDRGRAPPGYVKGMAVVFALCLTKLRAGDSAAKAMVRVVDGPGDVFDHLAPELAAVGLRTDGAPDVDRLRALFVILTGLGMRESSGRYCEGRDRSASNTSAETAEAGLFQMSWDGRRASPEIGNLLLANESRGSSGGLLEIFREGVTPHQGDLENFGSGNGEIFQEVCKTRPVFAVQCAAIGLRTLYTHWGPIIRHEVELRPEADRLFRDVQALVDASAPAKAPEGGWSGSLISALMAMIAGLFGWRMPESQKPSPAPSDRPPQLTEAHKYIGLSEESDEGNRTICKWMADLGGAIATSYRQGNARTIPWCAGFIGWCLHSAGLKHLDSLWALDYAKYGMKLEGPAVGAIGPMGRDGGGHVAFVVGRDQHGNIMCIGGNQGNAVSVKPFAQSRFVAFRWPAELPPPAKVGFEQLPIVTSDGATEGSEV